MPSDVTTPSFIERAGVQVPGYRIEELLYRLEGRVVYRACRLVDGAEVAIETLDTQYPERQQVAAIRREAAIAQRLAGIDGVRQVFATVAHGSGNLALVGELFEGTLRTRLEYSGGAGLPLGTVLDIALRLVRALDGVHSHDLVHKALMPEHILYEPLTGRLAVAGFGIASELDQERQALQMSRRLEGAPGYISPEQTGRMNRDLDYRSDYYSLGILLFELLTGRSPFQAETLLEWVHSHISRLPSSPHELAPHVPEALSAVVLRLLAKSPEARYQSARGLLHDLNACADAVAAGRTPELFVPGRHDQVQKFLVPQQLYGRDGELRELLGLFETVVAGATEFCLVHGYSGVGKSALVNEIDRPLVRERGFFVQGKFDQFQQGDAYTALAATFRGLVQQILAEPEASLAGWRQRLQEALAPNARLVINLVPELELIIGTQPAVVALPPAEERNRLHLVLTAFLRVFAAEGHPVVLFLDDLQWSDVPTLELLHRLVTSRELTHLLLIGAYRSNEVGAGHPLRLLLDDLQAQKNIRQLPVGPLERSAVAQLVADALCGSLEEMRPLSDMLYDKAQGNPFFTNELLRQLHKQGAITPDPESGRWHWEPAAARWSGMSNDVVEFMMASLRRLPAETQQALQLAACIGGTFDLYTLATIYEHSTEETAAVLLPALKQHTILPLHSEYRLVGGNLQDNECDELNLNPGYRFQHDRVQQAAYGLIDPERLPEVHLSMGRLLYADAGEAALNERLIDIVGHFNEGRVLMVDAGERQQLAQLNLSAAIRARHSAAFEAAFTYLCVAQELLPDDPWQQQPQFMSALAAEIQQCAYLTNRTEEAEQWIEILLTHAATDLERSNILVTRTRQYATLGRMDDSIGAAIEGLRLLGVRFTDQPTLEDIAEERRLVLANLGGRRIEDLVDAPLVEDEATLTAMRLLMEIFAAAFLSGSGNIFPYLVLKSANFSLQHGNCPESAFAYAAYGMLLCGELDEPALGFEYARVGLAINERLDDLTLRARVIYVYAMFVHHWSRHWSSLTPWFRKGIEAGYQSGDLLYLAYSAQDCVIWDPTLDLQSAERLHAEHLEIVRECAYQDSLDSGTLFLQLQRNLMGLTDGLCSLSDDTFDVQQCLAGMRQRGFMTGIANYHIYSAEICQLYGHNEQALEHVRAQDKLIKSAMSLPQLVRFYVVACLTLATSHAEMPVAEQQVTRARMEYDLSRIRHWADNCPENFLHLQYLMEAELARLDGNNDLALDRFDAAIDAARNSGFLRDEATANERAARHLLALGRQRSAEGYLRAAHRVYDRWGARRKVAHLEQEFPVLREMLAGSGISVLGDTRGDLDLASVMKASREISGEIVLDRLLKTTVAILLENAGGQWGCLVVRQEGRLRVAASKLPGESAPSIVLPGHSMVPMLEGGQLPLPVTLISQVLHSGEALVLRDACREGQFVQDPYMLKAKPRSVLCVPLRREGVEGVLYMENNLASDIFTRDRLEVIRLLAAQASVAMENAQLYEQVQDHSRLLEEKVAERTARLEQLNRELQSLVDRDGLTGVANRRKGDIYLQEVWVRLRREQRPLSVIMLDVDHFKAYNDTYGHQAGDDCLKVVAQAVVSELHRPADLVARYGGEEFMLILPDTDAEGVKQIGEKVRSTIETLAIAHQHSSVGEVVTISAGAASVIPQQDGGVAQLLRDADLALYQAKREGRNRVLHAAQS